MIAGEGLHAWLGDSRARAASASAVEAFGKAFRMRPEFERLEADLTAGQGRSAGGALSAARRFFADREAVDAALAAMIDAARTDCFFRPSLRTPLSAIHTGLILFDHPFLTLLIAVMSPDRLAAKRRFSEGPTSISFLGQQALYHFVRSGGAELSFWQAPQIGPNFMREEGLSCRHASRRLIGDGETVALDGRSEAFVIEHATSDLVYFQALTPLESAPVMVEFDSNTLRFAGASSTDDLGARVGMMLSLLRVMDRSDAAPLFADLLAKLSFHDRWRAMREFLALDANLALPHLRSMAQADPHPEVRGAAAATLDRFFAEARAKEDVLCLA